jgi:hypothetical protein
LRRRISGTGPPGVAASNDQVSLFAPPDSRSTRSTAEVPGRTRRASASSFVSMGAL